MYMHIHGARSYLALLGEPLRNFVKRFGPVEVSCADDRSVPKWLFLSIGGPSKGGKGSFQVFGVEIRQV